MAVPMPRGSHVGNPPPIKNNMNRLFSFFAIAALLAAALSAQNPVNQVGGPPPAAFVAYYGYSGSNIVYSCQAQGTVPGPIPTPYPNPSLTVSGGTLTSVSVSSNVGTITTVSAHGLYIGAVVNISLSTTSALNGSYKVLTVPTSTTATI